MGDKEEEKRAQEMVDKNLGGKGEGSGKEGEGQERVESPKAIPPVEKEVIEVRKAMFDGDPYEAPFEKCEEAAEWLQNHEDSQDLTIENLSGRSRDKLREENRVVDYYLREPEDSIETRGVFFDKDHSELFPLASFSNGMGRLYNIERAKATAAVLTGLTPWVDRYELEIKSKSSNPYIPDKVEVRINVLQHDNIDKEDLKKDLHPFLVEKRKEEIKNHHEMRGFIMTSDTDRILLNVIRELSPNKKSMDKEFWVKVAEKFLKRFKLFGTDRLDDVQPDWEHKSTEELGEHFRDSVWRRLKKADKKSRDEKFANPSNILFVDEL